MVCIAFGLCVCVSVCDDVYCGQTAGFAVKVTVEDCYFILDGVETCPQKERPPPPGGGMLVTCAQKFTLVS